MTLLEAFIYDPLATWRDIEFDWKRHANNTPLGTPLGTPSGTPVGTPRGGNNRSFQFKTQILTCNEAESDDKFEMIMKLIRNDQTLSEEGSDKIGWIKRKL